MTPTFLARLTITATRDLTALLLAPVARWVERADTRAAGALGGDEDDR